MTLTQSGTPSAVISIVESCKTLKKTQQHKGDCAPVYQPLQLVMVFTASPPEEENSCWLLIGH